MGRRAEEESNLESLLGPPPFLVGEDGNAYQTLKIRILSAVKPQDAIEEMSVREDIVDLLWETVRLRRFSLQCSSAELTIQRETYDNNPIIGQLFWQNKANGRAASAFDHKCAGATRSR
jgi:hypothetical protein